MTEIDGKKYITITEATDEIYKIKYEISAPIDIYNGTDDEIKIGINSDFTNGEYLTVGSRQSYNGFTAGIGGGEATIYIKSAAGGTISLAARW